MSRRQTSGYKGQLLGLDLSFLGWILLSRLPTVYQYLGYYLYQYDVVSLPGLSLPWQLYLALGYLFLLVGGLLYLPRFESCELAYFEAAKRTSGVGLGLPSKSEEQRGPDDLGGF